jgi:phosphatidylinositol alpha-1,6-mannosyltransferase
MRTLLISPDLLSSEGGIARIMRLYLKALGELAGTGDEIHGVVLSDGGDTTTRARGLAGKSLVGLDNCERNKWWFFLAVLWHGRKADRIICGHLHHLILARFAAVLRPRVKYYLVAHGIEVWRPYTVLERAALRDAHLIFCVSEYTRRQMLRFNPSLDVRRLVLMPNTFDPKFEGDVLRPIADKEQVGWPRLLVVSRLDSGDPYKGVDLMIEAMPLILQRFPKAQLRIVGGGNDRNRLEGLATELGLGSAVNFTGTIEDDDLRREYVTCDLFALPSRKEGFGLVFLEAMTYGKPCLAARAGGAPEVVNSEVGALVEYGNIEQIATTVADLINHPRDVSLILKQAKKFSFPAFRQRLDDALRT